MKPPRMRFATLDEQSLAKLHAMEEEFGSRIVALEPQYPLAKLPEDKVKQLESLEKELGVVLVAYER